MNSLIEEKTEVIRLRCLLEGETNPLIKQQIAFKLAYARLEHDIVECGVLEPERIERFVRTEKARIRKCRTGAVVCFIVAGIAAAILAVALFGCNTVDGIGRDLCAVSSSYIQEK